jgi:ferritin-like metal-binding protein YciE
MQREPEEESSDRSSTSEKVRQTAKDVAESVKSALSIELEDLKQLYGEEIRQTYDAENRIMEALWNMAESASRSEVKEAFEHHRDETKEQINRLEKIFRSHDHDPERAADEGIKGLIDKGTQIMNNTDEGPVRDAAMIAAAQSIEHYEMARYGTLRTYAEQLNFDQDVHYLESTLEEEKNTDKKLTDLAESSINPEAAEKKGESNA